MFLSIPNRMFNFLKRKKSLFPAGHYYSPIPDKEEITKRKHQIFKPNEQPKGININKELQQELLDELSPYFKDFIYKESLQKPYRYYLKNGFYGLQDGIILFSMLRHFKPKRIIEIGSGFSSAVMLDVNEFHLNKTMELTFIEPYTDRLESLLKKEDRKQCKIIPSAVQDVDLQLFTTLEKDDILFIDSTHVSKVGSDVNHIFFELLPLLKSGVIVHIHDISHNFEYPEKWIMEGRAWSENYLLRAFLMYNNSFEIVVFNSYSTLYCKEWWKEHNVNVLTNRGGSIWLRKI